MALQVNYTITHEIDCSKLIFKDTTCDYSSLGIPTNVIASVSSGGSFNAFEVRYYKITACDAVGESLASLEVNQITDNTNRTIDLTWNAVIGATKYRVYRGDGANLENEYKEVATNSYSDDNTDVFVAGQPPVMLGCQEGYGNTVNRVNVLRTTLTFTLPDNTVVIVDNGYRPTQVGIYAEITAADLGLSVIESDCYTVEYKVYGANVASGNIAAGKEYIVVDVTTGNTVTYNNSTYTDGETFVGIAGITTYTESSAANTHVSPLESSLTKRQMYACETRTLLVALAKQAIADKCQKDCDWVDTLTRYFVEYTSIMIAFEEGLDSCACDALSIMHKEAAEFFTKCCC